LIACLLDCFDVAVASVEEVATADGLLAVDSHKHTEASAQCSGLL
jgi:hypothetical protein